MPKLSWESFFEFNDQTPLNEAVKGLDLIIKKYTDVRDVLVSANKEIAEEISVVSDTADAMVKSLANMNIALEKNQKQLVADADASEDLVKEYAALRTVQDENVKSVNNLNKQIDDLTQTREESIKVIGAEKGSLDDLKKRLAEAERAYRALGDSTDEAVKQEHLDNIEALAAEYQAADKVLKSVKKGVQDASGSYNELSHNVADAKKRLKEMEGGVEGNSKEFKELQKYVKEGTVRLKEWDKEIGDNQRSVGDYGLAVEGLSDNLSVIAPGFGSASQQALQFGKALWALAANPVGAVILAIAAAIGALVVWFKRTEGEGKDMIEQVFGGLEQVLGVVLDLVADLGQVLFDALSEPKVIFEAFRNILIDIKNYLVAVWEDPIPKIKEFGKILVDQVVNRFNALIKTFKFLGGAISAFIDNDWNKFTKDIEAAGRAAVDALTGVEDSVKKVKDAMDASGLTASLQRAFDIGVMIKALEQEIDDLRIANIKRNAEIEFQIAKDLLDAKNKLKFSDEERYAFLREATKLSEEALRNELVMANKELKIAELRIEARKLEGVVTDDLLEGYNTAYAKILQLQTKALQERKRLQQQEIALIREIEKEYTDRVKRNADAERALNMVILNERIRTNKLILADEDATLASRLEALQEVEKAQITLLEDTTKAQIDAAKEAALSRVELSSEVLDEIYNQESLSVLERILLEREAKEKLIALDDAYVNEVLKIEEDFGNKTYAIIQETNKAAEENVFKILKRDADIFAAELDTTVNRAMIALNEAFAAGDIKTIEDYEARKLEIQEKAQNESLNAQLKYLKERASMLEAGSKERVDLEKSISEVELALSQTTANKQYEIEAAKEEAIKNLKTVAFESALTFIANMNAAADADREMQLEKLAAQQELELTLAGDNEEAKAKIMNDFAVKQKKIEDEQKAADRKRAIFEKALAITQVGVNTALAVSKALASAPPPANFVLAALVGAAGAIQIAAIASKQIPQFEFGTKSAPGGLAIVNEAGPELIVDPSGKARMIDTDGPTLANITKGSQVITAKETAKMLDYANYDHETDLMRAGVRDVIEVSQADNQRELMNTINRRMLSLEHTIRTKKEVMFNFTREGAEAIFANAETRTKIFNDLFS